MSLRISLDHHCQISPGVRQVQKTRNDRSNELYTSAVATVAAVSSVLSFYYLSFVYQLLMVGVIVLLFRRTVILTPVVRVLATLFVLNLIFIFISSIVFGEELAAVITVVGRYWSPILYSCILLSLCVSHGKLYFLIWYRVLIILTGVAFLQYFFSPTLWGIIPTDYSTLTNWSEGKSFEEYAVFYRATSLLGSPQVWGLYSALSIFVLSYRLAGGISIPLQIFLWSGCLLSGNKISAAIMIVLLAMRSVRHIKYLLMSAAVIAFAFTLMGGEEFKNFRVIEHILNIGDIGEQEQNGRLSIWMYIFGDMNFFLGGGASYVERLSTLHLFVAESYILQSWSEITVLFPLIFMLIIGSQLFARNKYFEHKVFVFLVLVCAVVSHAFSHPSFIVFWPMLLGIKIDYKI
ncbi:MAG: hypothetical protein RI902_728 [Pseudomonadota bacterium]